ncbi:hypothetical protein V6Z11_D12G105900 [Gossypium hirsutum]
MFISLYFTKLRLLWDEYDVLVPFSFCGCCGNSKQNADHIMQHQSFQFLMGLNDTYCTVRSQIFLMTPLPTVNQAYSMLVQESQRLHASGPVASDPTLVYSTLMTYKKQLNGVCDHCKIKGHKRESCYRLIGYPSNFKFTRKKVNNSAGSVNSVVAVESVGEVVEAGSSSAPQGVSTGIYISSISTTIEFVEQRLFDGTYCEFGRN